MARLAQPLGDGAEALAIGLVGIVARPCSSKALPSSSRSSSRRAAGEARRPRPVCVGVTVCMQPRGHVLEPAQDVVGADGGGLARGVSGDARVAVAIGADPRAPAQVGMDWPAVWCPCVRCRVPGPRAVLGRALAVQGARSSTRSTRAVQVGRDPEQRLVEEEQGRAHLVEGRGALGAQRRRAPQQRDLLAQPAPDLVVLVGRQARIVEPVDEREGTAQGHQHRCVAAPRWGGP